MTHQHRVDLGADGREWPVVDGIAWRREGREDLRQRAVDAVTAGDVDTARATLLTDVDDWWDEPPPTEADTRAAALAPTVAAALPHLRLGRVGDYFTHRWSDPSYLAALGLLRLAWPGPRPTFEVAAGAGHLLFALGSHGAGPLRGADVVFAKTWLAHRTVPAAELSCFDAGRPWPVATPDEPGLALCQDALYFLPDRTLAVAELRRVAGPGGVVAVGGIPNTGRGSGTRLTPQDLADLLPGARLFHDDELLARTLGGPVPTPRSPAELTQAPAFSAVWHPDRDATELPDPALAPDLGLPPADATLTVNPLYGPDGTRRWPTIRWAEDYAERASAYLPEQLPTDAELAADPQGWARRRVLLHLPSNAAPS